MNEKWVLWAAVSSLPQAKKISNENQLQLGREHAAKFGGIVADELIVPGESRSIILFEDACARIEAYSKLREHIERRDFDVFAFFDRSRIGRTAALSMTIVELCKAAGITCYELESPPATLDAAQNYSDMLIGAIKSVGAQNEVSKIRERRAKGMIGRVLDGKMPLMPNYGYKYDITGKQIIIDEPAASVVRRVCELYLLGRGSDVIINTIKSEFNINFYYSKVIRIFTRINVYAGYAEFNVYPESRDTRYKSPNYVKAKGNWEPIISEDTARRIEKERSLRSTKSASERQSYLLSGVCYCTICNTKMHVHRVDKSGVLYVRCRHIPHKHRNVQVKYVLAQFREAMNNYLANEAAPVVQDEMLLARLREAKQTHEAGLVKLAQSRKRADDAYVDGLMDADTYKAQIERIRTSTQSHEAQIAELDSRIDNEENRTQYAESRRKTINEVVALLDSTDVRYANLVLRNNFRIYITSGIITEIADVTD